MSTDAKLMPWSEYVDLLKPAGELNNLTFDPQNEHLRAELYRQLVMNISLGYFMYFQSDANHPDWAPFLNSVFMLQPNPDDTYFNAPLDGRGHYRIIGERGTVWLLTFSLGSGPMGTTDEPGQSRGYTDIDDLEIEPDGTFELILSSQRPDGYTGNWVHLPPEADYILVRQRCYDWGSERDARLAIERLDAASIKPRPSTEEIDQGLRALLGGFTERLSRRWLDYQNIHLQRGLINTLELTDFGGAVPPQWYWQGLFQFSPGEALILETEMPERHQYWNVQLNDELWNAVEFIYHQSSLNGHQATLDSDGRFRAVIALEDPGVANWLDPAGTLQAMLIGRWYGCSSNPIPTLKRVPLAQLLEHLPADTPKVTPAEREAVLRKRRIGGQLRRRW